MSKARLLAIATGLLLTGCATIPGAERGMTPTQKENTPRYLALGDSYTIGESVASRERFPEQLVRALRGRGVEMPGPLVIARTGWTTDELSAAIDDANLRGTFELVTLLIGVNNQYRGYPLDVYKAEFTALLERAIGFAEGDAGRVIVVSIPDWGVTPYAQGRDRQAIAGEIDAFNDVNRALSLAAGARYVDITPISRRAAREPNLIAPDGLHPSADMYAEWVALILPEAIAALE